MSASIADLLKHAVSELGDTHTTVRLDAEVLLAYLLGLSRGQLLAHPERPVPHDQQQRFMQLVARRRAGEPIAYLTEEREFWSLPLKVTPATLIPRPETELLVEECLRLIPRTARVTVLELGTGSGAIALALASERPGCSITAADIGAAALAVARQNAEALGIHNVGFVCGDWFTPVHGQRFQIIVSNPPYVAADDPHLKTGDLRYEPARALIGGPDGLTAIRTIVRQARDYLEQNGALLLEHGFGQAAAVRDLMWAAEFMQVHSVKDLAGIERVCAGTLGSPAH